MDVSGSVCRCRCPRVPSLYMSHAHTNSPCPFLLTIAQHSLESLISSSQLKCIWSTTHHTIPRLPWNSLLGTAWFGFSEAEMWPGRRICAQGCSIQVMSVLPQSRTEAGRCLGEVSTVLLGKKGRWTEKGAMRETSGGQGGRRSSGGSFFFFFFSFVGRLFVLII